MSQNIVSKSEITVGIDLGDRVSRFCILDRSGDVAEEGRMATKREAFLRKFEKMAPCRIALEVGSHSPWISRLLKSCGHEVLVANARELRWIYKNESKNDKVDAEQLARVARMDPKLLHPIQHRGPRAQAHLAILQSRNIAVEMRTKCINHLRGSLKAFGLRAPSASPKCFHKRVVEVIPKQLAPALLPIVNHLEQLTEGIKEYDRKIEALGKEEYPESHKLRQVVGVGPLTAMAYILTLEDPRRFQSSRSVGALLGLRPKQRQSGSKDPEMRITKTGDRHLRCLLVNAAHYVIGPFGKDCKLRRHGLALAERGGKNAKKRAAVAVARKLAVLLHRLWISEEVYDPFYEPAKRLRKAG